MILAFLIISLVIWTLSVLVNVYTISQQSKTSEISIMTIVSLIINLAMVTMNIIAIDSL
jgi:hypothetical protein